MHPALKTPLLAFALGPEIFGIGRILSEESNFAGPIGKAPHICAVGRLWDYMGKSRRAWGNVWIVDCRKRRQLCSFWSLMWKYTSTLRSQNPRPLLCAYLHVSGRNLRTVDSMRPTRRGCGVAGSVPSLELDLQQNR
jgi:hypothetical protein